MAGFHCIPTRITESMKSAIDLLFVNDNHRIAACGTIASSISDHLIIFCIVKSGISKATPKTLEYRSYKNYNKNEFLNDLKSVDWDYIIDNSENVDEAAINWSNTFNTIADLHAPFKTMRVKGLQVPWMNTELRKAMRDRDYNHRRAVKTKRVENWNEYKKLKSFVKCEMKQRKAEYYKELIEQNKAKPDKLWKCINEATGRNNKSTPTCIVSDGVCYTDAQSISEKLNTYFCTIGNILVVKLKSVYSTISTITVPSDDICNTEQFNFVPIPAEYVEKQLSCLQKNKAIGSDRISARLLKDASSVVATSLAKLFNRSLTYLIKNLFIYLL